MRETKKAKLAKRKRSKFCLVGNVRIKIRRKNGNAFYVVVVVLVVR